MEDSPRMFSFREEFEPFLKDAFINAYDITEQPGGTKCTCRLTTLEDFVIFLECSYMSYKVKTFLSYNKMLVGLQSRGLHTCSRLNVGKSGTVTLRRISKV
jgi:hypothetical protein